MGELPRDALAVARSPVVEHDLRAIAARCVHLDEGRVRGHDHDGGDVEYLGRQSQPLRVIARRKGYHAARALFRRQERQGIVRAAKLEGARPLKVLAFEIHAAAGHLVERFRGDDGRAMRLAVQPRGGGLNIGEGDSVVPHFASSSLLELYDNMCRETTCRIDQSMRHAESC
jgi:hypothetical protein